MQKVPNFYYNRCDWGLTPPPLPPPSAFCLALANVLFSFETLVRSTCFLFFFLKPPYCQTNFFDFFSKIPLGNFIFRGCGRLYTCAFPFCVPGLSLIFYSGFIFMFNNLSTSRFFSRFWPASPSGGKGGGLCTYVLDAPTAPHCNLHA